MRKVCLFLATLVLSLVASVETLAQASLVAGSVATSKTAYAVGAGNNRLIVVVLSDESATVGAVVNPNGITWGGQNLIRAGSVTSGTVLRGEIWYLNEAGISAARGSCTYNFVVTWTGGTSPTAEAFTAFTLQNVDQTTPVAVTNSAIVVSATSVALPATASGANDIVVYGAASTINTTIATIAAGYTLTNTQVIGATTTLHVATKQTPSPTSETPTPVWAAAARLLIVGVVFNGVAATGVTTYYSFATGAWDANTSWSLSANGSSGVVAAGVWPRRIDNVVIRSSHVITVNETDDNKYCGISPDGLALGNVGPGFTPSNIAAFYQSADVTIQGTLSVIGIINTMTAGNTHILPGGSLTVLSSYINIGYLEAESGSTFDIDDKFVISGSSTSLVNTTTTVVDDFGIDHTNATICGTGTATLQNGAGSAIVLTNSATMAQICTSFTVTCPSCGAGTGVVLLGNSGPGGVGNSTNNLLWLRASDLSLANGAAVTTWADASGNGFTATAPGTAANQPAFNTNVVNTLPAVAFNGLVALSEDWLTLGTPAALNIIPGTNSSSFFCAFNVPATRFGTLFSKSANTNRQYQYTVDGNFSFASSIGSNFFAGGVAGAVNGANWFTVAHSFNTTQKNSWVNENVNVTASGVGAATTTADILLGGRRNDNLFTTEVGFPLTGSIAEIAVYNVAVTPMQRIIVDNYLSAKYATPNFAAGQDFYTMDNSGFDFDVAGIGQFTDGTNHRDAKGSGVVRMWNPSSLVNGDYLFWGHDGVALNSSTTSGVDGTIIIDKLSRTWAASETGGDVGTVSVSFDLSAVSGTYIGSNLRLLIDRNANGFADNDVTPVSGSFSGNVITFTGINFQNGDRFTIGNTDITNPLPIELLNFSATTGKGMVTLNWSTASELNNDFFTVERSGDGEKWASVVKVNGAGTSTQRLDYQTVDEKPIHGPSYYRLKQTDFDKNFKYSKVIRVRTEEGFAVAAYPNPSSGTFTLDAGFEVGQDQLKLLDILGRQLPVTISKDGEVMVIDPGNIPPGIYFVHVTNGYWSKSIRISRN